MATLMRVCRVAVSKGGTRFGALLMDWEMPAGAGRKPNSVPAAGFPASGDDHSSRVSVAEYLLRPTRELGRATLKRSSIWSCTGWGLPSFPGHPGNWCALTAPFHPYRVPLPDGMADPAVCFLLHFPSRRRDSALRSTLPCGVRTFLRDHMSQRSSGLLRPAAAQWSPRSQALSQYKILLQKGHNFKLS